MKKAGSENNVAPDPWDIGFGAALFTLALLALLVWFPNDIKGGFVETNFVGKTEPGDAFFPVLLAGTILVLSGFHLLRGLFSRRASASAARSGRLTRENFIFLALFHLIVITGLAMMYWLGPLTVSLANLAGITDLAYRQLVDTVPYKYVGYVAGAFVMTASLITWTEGGLRRRSLFTILLVIAGSILVFDVLLTNVQLPPNADY
ncbi:MAG: hypothetical protein ACTSP0_08060 [Alphaproteobacteria bacterium]